MKGWIAHWAIRVDLFVMGLSCLLEDMQDMAAKPKTVLLVEDNADDERLTLRAMNRSEVPNIIQVARDGEQAVNFLFGPDAVTPDLILMDLKLPKLNGLEILRRVRKSPETAAIPVVILTSSDEEVDIRESYKLRANSFVRKPVDFKEFIDAVRELSLYWLSMNRSPQVS
jgi:CheY-like chemotaxis protein